MSIAELETPKCADELYLARADEVDADRALFTGDVFLLEGTPHIVLQHPCAIRSGPDLNPSLLVAPCREDDRPPQSWRGHYKKMPLPHLRDDRVAWCADLVSLAVTNGPAAEAHERIAQLSERGVNLLLQRWVYHNTRVVVPTSAFQEALAPQFAEVELESEWVVEARRHNLDRNQARADFASWLDEDKGKRRKALADSQTRAGVRREARSRWAGSRCEGL